MKKERGYVAVLLDDDTYSYLCHAITKEDCKKIVLNDGYDINKVNIYPYYQTPYEVL